MGRITLALIHHHRLDMQLPIRRGWPSLPALGRALRLVLVCEVARSIHATSLSLAMLRHYFKTSLEMWIYVKYKYAQNMIC